VKINPLFNKVVALLVIVGFVFTGTGDVHALRPAMQSDDLAEETVKEVNQAFRDGGVRAEAVLDYVPIPDEEILTIEQFDLLTIFNPWVRDDPMRELARNAAIMSVALEGDLAMAPLARFVRNTLEAGTEVLDQNQDLNVSEHLYNMIRENRCNDNGLLIALGSREDMGNDQVRWAQLYDGRYIMLFNEDFYEAIRDAIRLVEGYSEETNEQIANKELEIKGLYLIAFERLLHELCEDVDFLLTEYDGIEIRYMDSPAKIVPVKQEITRLFEKDTVLNVDAVFYAHRVMRSSWAPAAIALVFDDSNEDMKELRERFRAKNRFTALHQAYLNWGPIPIGRPAGGEALTIWRNYERVAHSFVKVAYTLDQGPAMTDGAVAQGDFEALIAPDTDIEEVMGYFAGWLEGLSGRGTVTLASLAGNGYRIVEAEQSFRRPNNKRIAAYISRALGTDDWSIAIPQGTTRERIVVLLSKQETEEALAAAAQDKVGISAMSDGAVVHDETINQQALAIYALASRVARSLEAGEDAITVTLQSDPDAIGSDILVEGEGADSWSYLLKDPHVREFQEAVSAARGTPYWSITIAQGHPIESIARILAQEAGWDADALVAAESDMRERMRLFVSWLLNISDIYTVILTPFPERGGLKARLQHPEEGFDEEPTYTSPPDERIREDISLAQGTDDWRITIPRDATEEQILALLLGQETEQVLAAADTAAQQALIAQIDAASDETIFELYDVERNRGIKRGFARGLTRLGWVYRSPLKAETFILNVDRDRINAVVAYTARFVTMTPHDFIEDVASLPAGTEIYIVATPEKGKELSQVLLDLDKVLNEEVAAGRLPADRRIHIASLEEDQGIMDWELLIGSTYNKYRYDFRDLSVELLSFKGRVINALATAN